MSSLFYDIVVLPTEDLAQEAISLSEQLAQYGALYALKDGEYYPHISLYMTQLKIEDLGRVNASLTDIAKMTSQLSLVTTQYSQAEGYIDAEYACTEALARLQKQVVEAVNPIRYGVRPKDQARMLTTEGKVRDNLQTYGYRYIGELFRPHMTFTRFTNTQPIDTAKLPVPTEFNGTFVKLGLFEVGDNGTCIRSLAEYDLGGSNG